MESAFSQKQYEDTEEKKVFIIKLIPINFHDRQEALRVIKGMEQQRAINKIAFIPYKERSQGSCQRPFNVKIIN